MNAGALAAALLLAPTVAAAQAPSPETGRALLQRQQQSDRFSLELRQSQSLVGLPAAERRKLDAFYRDQRREQERLHDAQLRQAAQEPETMRAGAAERHERERRVQDAGFETPPQSSDRVVGRPDPDAGVRWTPTLEERPSGGVSWAPTLEKRRP
jgi:hypothetical protein